MFCSNCGEKIEDSSSFCKNCGAKITNNDKTERVQLKCKECGGVMTADSSNKKPFIAHIAVQTKL